MEIKKQNYRVILFLLFLCSIGMLLCAIYFSFWRSVPGTIKIRVGKQEKVDLTLPASGTLRNSEEAVIPVSFRHPLVFLANEMNHYKMDVRLFGIIPLKAVDVQVIQDKTVIPAGIPIGIYVKTEGVLVIGTGEFTGYDGVRYAPSENILQEGDYILDLNGCEVTGKKMFMDTLQEQSGDTVILTIRRKEECFRVKIPLIMDQKGTKKIGIWIRDNAQGVGTLTYLDSDGCFGALGHGINDLDTGTLMELKRGNLYHADIIGITKGKSGSPGELTGLIDYSNDFILGEINQNREQGIYGYYDKKLKDEIPLSPMKIGLKQDVKKGAAQILCSLDGKTIQAFDAVISEIKYDEAHLNREIVLQITDPELIEKTGGIIQGMSGAPIIQEGKLIGAVTHVFVQDATKGYGIFIEEMLEYDTPEYDTPE